VVQVSVAVAVQNADVAVAVQVAVEGPEIQVAVEVAVRDAGVAVSVGVSVHEAEVEVAVAVAVEGTRIRAESLTGAFSRLSSDFSLIARTPQSGACRALQILYLVRASDHARVPARVFGRNAERLGPTLRVR
jgi:hypothetical protein